MSDEQGEASLNTVQRWFQAVISHPGGVAGGVEAEEAQRLMRLKRSELEKVIRRSKNLTAEERLGVYANAYYARLLECLRESFPVLCGALGRELFDEFAFDYLQRYPSTSYTLNRLGDHFADFLEETRPDKGNAEVDWPDFLIDLARLEWTIEQVFDGPGVEGKRLLTAEDLRGMDAGAFAGARLQTVVCLRLMEFKYPVNDYYTAARRAKEGDEAPDPPEPGRQYLALTRREFVVRRMVVSGAQHALLAALQRGETVGEAIAAAAEVWEGEEAEFEGAIREWFAEWVSKGVFEGKR